MKNSKKIVGLGTLLLVSLFFLWNCEPDVSAKLETQQVSDTNFKRSIVSEHYLESHEPYIYQSLKNFLGKKSDGVKKEYSDEYGFEYDLDRVQIIEAEHFTQYSLLVKGSGTDDTHFENYVLMEYANGNQEQLLFTFEKNGDGINHQNTQVQVLEGDVLLGSRCQGGYELVDVEVISGCFEIPCSGNNLHMPGEYCPCGTLYDCIPPQVTCGYDTVQQWRPCSAGGDENPNDPNNPPTGGGNNGGDEDSTDEEIPIIPVEKRLWNVY